ncbi:MAG TPA: serine/threonine-protein kinase [Kofleriaceae bacterium]|jgi:tetratricopeptide (TPR) repeat protein
MNELAETAPEAELPTGTEAQIGRYTIKRVVGSGAMGIVLAAHDPELDRMVAIKLIKVADDGPVREAQAMAKLSHPNVVQVYEVLHLEDRKAIVMELVDGEDLSGWQKDRPWRDIVDVYLQASRGLAAAHAAGIVHRDFKPSNVLVDKAGKARVSDFGLARSVPTGAPRLDATGIAGTPVYMAPEQHAGGVIDARTDQWGFACALYEGLYGHRPFSASEGPQLAAAVEKGTIEDEPSGSPVPRRIRAAVRRSLSVDPAARFASMDELGAVLAPPSRRIALGVTAALVIVGVVTSALLLRRDDGATCEGLDAPMESVWNDAARTSLRARLSAPEVGLPAASIDRTLQKLDAYAASWTTTRGQACIDGKRGVRSSIALDKRMKCLDRGLAQMSGVLDGVASGDNGALRAAGDAISQLGSPATCTEATEAAPHALTPALQADLDQGEAELARANALVSLGQFEKARAAANKAITAATQTASESLQARALLVIGESEHRLHHGQEAYDTYERAAQVAARAKELAVVADALSRAFLVEIDVLGHVADGLKTRPFVELAIDSAGRPDDVRASWLHFLAIVLYDHERKLDEAAASERESLAIRQRTLPPDHFYIYDSLETLGNIEAARRNYDEAERLLKQVLASRIAARGPRDITVSSAYNNLALVALGRDDMTTAIDYLQAAITITTAEGKRNENALYNLGIAQMEVGRWTDATATFTRYASDVQQSSSDDTHPVCDAATFLGVVAILTGDIPTARTQLDRGVDACRTSGSVRLATSLSYAARVAVMQKDPKRARALIDEAMPLKSSNAPLRTLAAAEVSLSETTCAVARPTLTAAYDNAVKEEFHVVVSQAVITLATCELELGDKAAAQAHLDTELAWLTKNKADEVALAPVRALLARTK